MLLINSYHGTSYTTTKTDVEVRAIEARSRSGLWTPAERRWTRKVQRALCPSRDHGCTCSYSVLGERG
jgi:hypothetical protein